MSVGFDVRRGKQLIGKHALIGLTYLNQDGSVRSTVQKHGRITAATPQTGVLLREAGTGAVLRLPPDLDAFRAAHPGAYRLRGTGEIVTNPDLIASWSVLAPER